MKQLTILLGDDHQLITTGLRDVLLKEPIVSRVDCANNSTDLLQAVDKYTYDIVFLDIHFGKADGREIATQLLQKQPYLILAALTSFDDSETIQTTVNAGFKAFFLKSDDIIELVEWIGNRSFDTFYLSRQTKESYTSQALFNDAKKKTHIQLTTREKQVLKLIMDEYTTKRIAEELFLSEKTIENYRSSLMLKLDVTNLTGLVKKTLLLGLLNE
ncbi:LuxR C-terminal-related transcriptional regulator [Fluviicola taffensis]|uniref:Two component transcriptional regulator, LuxR family n=1 Tax=Fluviicola taffensis (strain DSM 16823 / NCIMB 13979 / RW262) TaxID=755732 RepID=F2IHK6_FLUTR|nr:response regulator transcription factor [Fluviicola taffensis]AEA43771.1 two component transcriptional regulator, LuxR family [Fluviicola taffensis DSM 16823]